MVPLIWLRTGVTGRMEALLMARRWSAWPRTPKTCLQASGVTHSSLLEVVDVYHELNPTTAALGEQGAWD